MVSEQLQIMWARKKEVNMYPGEQGDTKNVGYQRMTVPPIYVNLPTPSYLGGHKAGTYSYMIVFLGKYETWY